MTGWRRYGKWLVLTLVAIAAAPGARADLPSYPALFGTREVRSVNLAPFQKWTGMMTRQLDERPLYEGPCTARRFNRCHLQEWRRLLQELDSKDPMAQLDAVNSFMNRAPYITDPVNYGVPDYWATPLQFLSKDGDCEDYAIAKFASLRQLGFRNAQMRIVVVDDLNLKIAHAVLVVYIDGRAYVLDNQISRVVPAELINHYRPVFSINEDAWWLHRR
jgi:predicted transglutaminase-like cysteine proteinase